MPHVDLMFPSKYLKGEAIKAMKTGEVTVTIKSVTPDTLRKKDNSTEKCWIVKLAETDKMWVLNVTNAKRIAALYGKPMSEDWPGLRVILTTEKVNAFGAWHNAIRVKEEKPPPKKAKPSTPRNDEAEERAALEEAG